MNRNEFISSILFWGCLLTEHKGGEISLNTKPTVKTLFIQQATSRQQILEGGPVLSLPIPLKRASGNVLAFFSYYYRPEKGDDGLSIMIYRPEEIFTASWTENPEIKKIPAKLLLSKNFIEKFSGEKALGISKSSQKETKFLERDRKRLYELYDFLIPVYFFPETNGNTNQEILKANTVEFNLFFLQFCQLPLFPYYKELGKDFFAWIDKIIGETVSPKDSKNSKK